jgi:hypothetical protein
MFENILRGFSKFFTNQRIIMLVIFLVLAWALLMYSGVKKLNLDSMTNVDNFATPSYGGEDMTFESTPATVSESDSESFSAAVTPQYDVTPQQYASQPVANPNELLPNDQNSAWAALNPNSLKQGDVLMPDLLQAGYHIGLDTIGQTLRNANLQLRSDPVIQRSQVGPWNQSTIEPDLGRVPLELGAGFQ